MERSKTEVMGVSAPVLGYVLTDITVIVKLLSLFAGRAARGIET